MAARQALKRFGRLVQYAKRRRTVTYARQESMVLRPRKRAELIRKFEADILPLLRDQQGFVDAFTLVNPAGEDVLVVSLWDSKENADAYSRRVYPDVYGILAELIQRTPRVQYYEVTNSTCHKIATKLYAA